MPIPNFTDHPAGSERAQAYMIRLARGCALKACVREKEKTDDDVIKRYQRSTMPELAGETINADKVLIF